MLAGLTTNLSIKQFPVVSRREFLFMSKHILATRETDKTLNIYKNVPTIGVIKLRIYRKQDSKKLGTATISAKDLNKCLDRVWTMRKGGYVYSGTLALHRYLAEAPNDKEVDHINGNPRNNQQNNLRIVGRKQQMQNRKKHKTEHPINKNVPIAGVYWNGASWTAEITKPNGKKRKKKCETMVDAILERIHFEEIYYKEFARNKEDVLKWILDNDRAKMFGQRN